MTDFKAPLVEAVSRVGERWTLLVVEALIEGPRRFGELQKAVEGIATNVLSDRIRRLEREGVVIGRPYSQRPVRMAYELTASGRELAGALRLLSQWGANRAGQAAGPRHEACGTPTEVRWYCPTCSRTIGDAEASDITYA